MARNENSISIDIAGGSIGGAARWRNELNSYLSETRRPIDVIGRNKNVTPTWIIERELLARNAQLAIATNNVSFCVAGKERRVLLRNALHFLYQDEQHLLRRMPPSFRIQVPTIHTLAKRADEIIVPCSQMADRVIHHLPSTRARIAIMPHPVTPIKRSPDRAETPSILVPVVPGPYKNLIPHLTALIEVMDQISHPGRVYVTAASHALSASIAGNPRLTALGIISSEEIVDRWRSATAVFYPSEVEAFGYPLAEARANGLPVIAPDTAQAAEIAGETLCGYRKDDTKSIASALQKSNNKFKAEPGPFDAKAYFDWLFASSRSRPQQAR